MDGKRYERLDKAIDSMLDAIPMAQHEDKAELAHATLALLEFRMYLPEPSRRQPKAGPEQVD